MGAFLAPLDIWNRALDHAGGRAVSAAPPTDTSRNAAKCSEVYNKLRAAELRRNPWVFSTRKAALRPIDTTTMLLVPAAYNSATFYYVADIVSYLGTNWICIIKTSGNVAPVDGNGLVSPSWDNYYGPMTVDAWQAPNVSSTTSTVPTNPVSSYYSGEIVYLAPGDGTFTAFISLVDANTDDPLGADLYVQGTTYNIGQVVEEAGVLYQSSSNFNFGNDPNITTNTAVWSGITTYNAGDYAFGTDNQVYQSVGAANLNHNPTTDSTQTYWVPTGMWGSSWTTIITPQPRSTSNNWHYLVCSLQPLALVFPLGSGPLTQTLSRNLFMLPYNFLMKAAEENQLGSRVSWAGAHDPLPDDYIFQGNYIISASYGPIVLRFISDFQNVALMDPMFCEGLAARMGWELCETLTQKPDLRAACLLAYNQTMSEARMVNCIEVGPVDQTEDEYIRCRI